MTTKIGDRVSMYYCKSCELVFDNSEESRCPRCWDTEDTCYATLKLEGFEEKED